MFDSLFKRDQSDKPILVVDLDQTTVRVLEVCPTPTGVSVRWGASVLNLKHAKSYRQAATEALRKLLSTHGITTKRASLLLSGPSTVALPLELPPLPPDEVASAVQWSALRVMPFPLAEAILGHHPLDSKPESKERTVLMAAVKRSALDESVNIAQDAGLSTVKVSVLPLALGGVIQALPVKPDETTLVLTAWTTSPSPSNWWLTLMPVISSNALVSVLDSYSCVGMVSDRTLISMPWKGAEASTNHCISFNWSALERVDGWNSESIHFSASAIPAKLACA